jgi:hypothetical protein
MDVLTQYFTEGEAQNIVACMENLIMDHCQGKVTRFALTGSIKCPVLHWIDEYTVPNGQEGTYRLLIRGKVKSTIFSWNFTAKGFPILSNTMWFVS